MAIGCDLATRYQKADGNASEGRNADGFPGLVVHVAVTRLKGLFRLALHLLGR